MAEKAPRRANHEDVSGAPADVIAEVIKGVLYTQRRPDFPHGQAASALSEELGPPFKRGRGGPGGWIILYEPEVHLGPGPDILVPDLAGWRREALPQAPSTSYATHRPDYACEIHSPSTRARDRVQEMSIYSREQVPHVWLVDPESQTLEVFRFEGTAYVWIQAFAEECSVRAEPFDAIAFDLGVLWPW
jgi:Uma2 family endonuclease